MEYRNKKVGILKKKIKKLQVFHGNIKKYNYVQDSDIIIELGAGKLNDLENWTDKGIKRIIAVESDKNSIEEGRNKYKNILKKRKNLPKIDYILGDVTSDNFVDDFIKKFKDLKEKVDHIYCNFSIHYFIRSPKDIISLHKLINYFLKIGGTFNFTTIDGQDLYNILKNNKVHEIKQGEFTLFRIKRLYNPVDKFKDYGQKISVYVISIGHPTTEYLINVKYI